MNWEEYTDTCRRTALYPDCHSGNPYELMYLSLGMVGEAGEVANKIKKYYRDGALDEEALGKELGDILWYFTRLCDTLGLNPSDLMQQNHDKLASRMERGVIKGAGDDR